LSLSPKTVETYRARIMKKLKVKDTVELVKFSMRHGLIS
jgi:DNA-binding NarL/FixJ family response regulator